MASNISSPFSEFNSLKLQLAEIKTASVAGLLSSGDTSIASFTQSVASAKGDLLSISSISAGVGKVAAAAESNGISGDAIDNVRVFASQLQKEGYDTLSIMNYLGQAEELAKSDPDKFTELFSGADSGSTGTTISAIDDTAS